MNNSTDGSIITKASSLLDRVRMAKDNIKVCRTHLENRGIFVQLFCNREIELFDMLLNELARCADELLITLQMKEQFVHQQLMLEQRVVNLGSDYLERITHALTNSKMYFAALPEIRDPLVTQVIRDVATKIENYDNSVAQKLLEFNERVRKLERYRSERHLGSYAFAKDLPGELEF